MEIIVPAAGLSTRFPFGKPKYLLYDYKHTIMLKNSILQYINKGHNITIGILKEHDVLYEASLYIRKELPEINIIILEEKTKGPADTVYQIIKKSDLNKTNQMLIKDCDSFFEHEYDEGNVVYTTNIKEQEILKKLSSKSFVIANNQDIITDIIEKTVVSDTFCVGAYQFKTVDLFERMFERLSYIKHELFVSHIIHESLKSNETFVKKSVQNYTDVGTIEDWVDYNNKPVIFCDIDGTIIKSQGRYGINSYYDKPEMLTSNIKRLLEYQSKKSQFIFTTSREDTIDIRKATEMLLYSLGFKNFTLLMGLNNSKRILINDYNSHNPYPRAEAINIKRNCDNLEDYLK